MAGKRLWGSVLLPTVLQVAAVELPFLQRMFGTASLQPDKASGR
ncbi:hypothetical protein [Pseudarthrobacter sp. S9]